MVCAIIQARMSSNRLPGKVLRKINGKPMLELMIERVLQAQTLDKVIVVTSLDKSDNEIEIFCQQAGFDCYRGSLDDVLDRYYGAANEYKVSTVVRLTGDCPLIDPKMIDDVVNFYKDSDSDYVANSAPPEGATVPDGMDVEVFSYESLAKAHKQAQKPSEREHVTFYFWHNPDLFKCKRFDLDRDLSMYRLTVDYKEDFELVGEIYQNLYKNDAIFSLSDIIELLNNNENLRQINENIIANQGWQSAFDKDREAGF